MSIPTVHGPEPWMGPHGDMICLLQPPRCPGTSKSKQLSLTLSPASWPWSLPSSPLITSAGWGSVCHICQWREVGTALDWGPGGGEQIVSTPRDWQSGWDAPSPSPVSWPCNTWPRVQGSLGVVQGCGLCTDLCWQNGVPASPWRGGSGVWGPCARLYRSGSQPGPLAL